MKDNTKVSINRQRKEKIVAQLSDKVARAKALVFANYQGMTHKQLEELKKALAKVDAELTVTKNTLLKLALKEKARDTRGTLDTSDTFTFEAPTATLFAYSDAILPLKQLAKTIKSLKLPVIKFGILEGKVLSDVEVLKLSTLPSREVLIAQLVGGLKSPIFGLHRALNWNRQKLVLTLNAIENSKSETRSTKQI